MAVTCLVTGGTSGIGRAIVDEFARRSPGISSTLVINYRRDDEAFEEVKSAYPDLNIVGIKADLSTKEGVDSLVAQVTDADLTLDYVFLNVGTSLYAPFSEISFEDWEATLRTNLSLPMFVVQGLMTRLTRGMGSVLLVSSFAGIQAYSTSLVYGISKAGLAFAAKALVKELEPLGARVNAVAPGFIETRWQDGRSDESRARINAKIAAHRFGTSEEVAKASWDIASNPYINGSILEVHGGYGYF